MTDAYEPPPQNDLIRPVAFCALMVLGAWNVAGWLASDAPLPLRLFQATLTLMFEVLCFNVGAQKARADERATSDAVRRYWFWALIMCCGWSMFSAHHALILFTPEMDNLQRAPAYVVLVLAAAIIPLLPWAIERTERAPKLDTPEPAQQPLSVPANPRQAGRPRLRAVGNAALAAGLAGAAMGTHAVAPPQHVGDPGDQAWRAQARDLWMGGMRNKAEIARRIGRPRESVRRELARLGA